MKKYFKFMTAALAVGALVSCTDELIDNQKLQVKDGDLIGYLQSPTDGEETRVAYAPGINDYVWADGDAIRVYTLNQLLYNSYELTGGEGTQEGVFTLTGDDNVGSSTDKKYAVTEPAGSNTIYGISAENNKALLTATVLPRYDWDDVVTLEDGSEIEGYKLPTPFWGEATVNGANINVKFQALTSFIKLDLRRLPIGTQAIVLTSHEDYYTVAPKGDPAAVLHQGGGNEPLAGTMNAILEDGAALSADTRLVSYDTLRIDFDKVEEIAGEDKILYIPIPAQHYAKLDLLAVTTDNRAPYTWTEADVIASWTDEEFKLGKTKGVYLDAEYEIFETDPLIISQMIARRFDGNHDVRVKLMNPVNEGTLYILNNGQEQGLEYTNVEITFAEKLANNLDIVECPASIFVGGAGNVIQWQPLDPTIATENSVSKEAKQTVKLNFEKGSEDAKVTNIYLPESDVVLTTGNRFRSDINIIASRTNNISGYEEAPKNQKKAGIILKGGYTYEDVNVLAGSEKTAVYAYEDETEIVRLRIYPEQPGSIRLTDAWIGTINYQAKNITGNPIIVTTGAAAIKKIVDEQNKVKVHAYWTMKSLTDKAVLRGYEGAEVEDDENPSGVVYTAAQLQAIGLDKSLEAASSAFTSGKGVLDYEVSKKVAFIWLGGQEFPWIGPQIGIMRPDLTTPVAHSDRQLVDPNFTLADPYDTQELDDEVVIDFNYVELRNMEMTINDPYFDDPHKCCTSCGEFVVKVERDLGLIRNINTKKTADVKNVRLNDVELICSDPKVNIPNVGSIVGRISADGDVTMNDNRVTNLQIGISGGNAGGHVGNILSEGGNVTITNALAGQYDFAIGGTTENPGLGFGNYAESNVDALFVVTIGENAGGLVGQLLAPAGKVQIKDAVVGLNFVESFGYKNVGGNNAGGLVGNLAYGAGKVATTSTDSPSNANAAQFISVSGEENATVIRGTVNIDFIETYQAQTAAKQTNESLWGSTGNNAGGFVGKAWAAQLSGDPNFDLKDKRPLQMVIDGTVNAQYLTAQNRYAGGLIGYNKQREQSLNDHLSATFISSETDAKHDTKVNIGTLTAAESVAGGLIGQQVMGDLVIGGGSTAKNQDVATVEVKINKLATSFAGGGLVGQNLDDVDINTKYRADETSNKTGKVIAKVESWENTWEASDFTTGRAGETPATLRMFCGSFDNLVGLVSEHFKVKNNDLIEIKGLIPDATKKALLFQLHTDPTNTKGVSSDPYWGDQLGYVGYADASSFYLLNGTDFRQGDQQFNYRFPY